jgi:Asp-tRNA(Asn)/Glu-tRNA(Gln) amidotransferase A subunit family amidase
MFTDPARISKKRNWQVGLVYGPKWGQAEPYAQQSLVTFAGNLHGTANIRVKEIQLPERLNQVHEFHAILYDRTLAYYFKEEFKQKTLVSPTMYEIIRHGNSISLEEYKKALVAQNEISRELNQFMVDQKLDILLDLSTGGEALKGLDSVDRPDHCLIWTFCGVPAINLPVFIGPNQMPFGAQIVSRRYNDYMLLSFAENLTETGIVPEVPYPALSY